MLADVVVVVHVVFVLFVLGGGLLALRWRWMPWVHLPAAAWGAAVELFGWYCPLTPLENRLRAAGDAERYAGSFIEHYLLPLLYPGNLTRELQLGLGIFVVVLNVAVYAAVWRRRQGNQG